MATFREHEPHFPWSGTTQDLARIARLAFDLVSDASEGENDIYFTARVSRPGREDSFGSPDEFENDGLVSDVDLIEDVGIHARGQGLDPDVSVYVSFSVGRLGGGGCYTSIEGTSQVAVHGVAASLRNELFRRRRRGRWLYTAPWVILAPIAGLTLAGASQQSSGHRTTALVLAVLALCLVALAGILLLINFLRPKFELRRPDQPQRVAVIRKLSFWLVGAVATAFVTLAVAALIRAF